MNEEMRLSALVEEEKKAALNRPLGVAFVTLGQSLFYCNCFNFKLYTLFGYRLRHVKLDLFMVNCNYNQLSTIIIRITTITIIMMIIINIKVHPVLL